MKFNAEKRIGSGLTKALRRIGVLAAAAAFSLSLAAGTAAAGDQGGRRAGDDRQSGSESKIYGIVEKLPQDEIGTWIVSGREVVVTRDTRIKEKHGRAEAGAYVEVEGNAAGNALTAYEIEVKRSKQSSR